MWYWSRNMLVSTSAPWHTGGAGIPTNSTAAYASTDATPVFNTQYRSTIEIVWSCLAIIFASTWICVHPNVAGYKTTLWQRLWKRVKLFLFAIFAPELLAVFAFFQWRGSRRLHRDFKRRAEEKNLYPSSNSEVIDGSGPGNEEANDDRSELLQPEKRGLMAKGAQQTSRRPRLITWVLSLGDPKDNLWTYTHAHFVQMGGILFKGPDGQAGFQCPDGWDYEEIKNFFALQLPEAAISDRSKGSALAKTLVIMQVLWFTIQTIARAVEGLPITHLEVVCLAFTVFNIGMYICWWDKPLDVVYPLEVTGIPGGDSTFWMGADDWLDVLSGGLDELPVGVWIYSSLRRLYPSLYCYRDDPEESKFVAKHFATNMGGLGGTFTLAISFTSASFGALHCIGWSLPSPSPVEHTLWRIAFLVLLSYPLIPLIFCPIRKRLESPTFSPRVALSLYFLIAFISALGGIAYILARVILLVLPFLELRDLPPLVHQTVSWSNFLPHI